MWVEVVLPLVPVIPTTGILSEGWPKNAAEMGPIARRTLGTSTWVTAPFPSVSTQRSTTSARAPARTACEAKS